MCMVKHDDYITWRLSSRLGDSRRSGAHVVQQEHARLRRLLQIVVQCRERLRQPPQRGQQPLIAPRGGAHQRASAAPAPVRRGMDGSPVRDAELAGPPEHEVRVRALGHPLRDRLEERREERGGEVAKRGRHRIRFLVTSTREIDLSAYMAAWLKGLKLPTAVRVSADIDPYSFL